MLAVLTDNPWLFVVAWIFVGGCVFAAVLLITLVVAEVVRWVIR